MTEVQHVYLKMALHFGWDRIGLICDPSDGYAQSFFDSVNGTDPSNPRNLQPPVAAGGGGPYDAPRLNIAHAEPLNLATATNASKDALVATLKAKDIKVFIIISRMVSSSLPCVRCTVCVRTRPFLC